MQAPFSLRLKVRIAGICETVISPRRVRRMARFAKVNDPKVARFFDRWDALWRRVVVQRRALIIAIIGCFLA